MSDFDKGWRLAMLSLGLVAAGAFLGVWATLGVQYLMRRSQRTGTNAPLSSSTAPDRR